MTFVETPIVELKRTFVPAIKKEIVAFANTDGGTIYIGVEDDGNVIGVVDAQQVADAVNTMIHEAIVPDLSMFAEAHVEQFDDVDLVVVTVHRGPDRPYCIAGKGLRPEGVYVRQGTSAQPLPYDGIRHMLRQTNDDSFESARSLHQDLTFTQAAAVFGQHDIAFGVSQQKSLGLRDSGDLFTNMGYLLSDQCTCGIKIARFSGTTKAIFQTRREFTGSVLKQVEDAAEMLDMLNNTRASISARPERIESRDYPPEALRETLLNAVVHRDYGIRADIGINMFDDRCEIVSPGGLPHGATRDGALAGISVARNAGLAAIFYRLRWIEAYGTGIAKITGAYADGGMQPKIEFLDGATKVILPNVNAKTNDFAHSVVDAKKVISGEVHAESCELSPDKCAVLAVFDEDALSKREVSNRVGFSPSKTARLLKDLAAEGYIVVRGTTKDRTYRRVAQ